MTAPAPFDAALRRLRRDRAARLGARVAPPQFDVIADELIARLEAVNRPFARALDLGCGPGLLTERLTGRGLAVTSLDAGRLFADGSSGVRADEDRLPFPAASFDLVVSAGVLDSVNDLPGALVQVRRALRPDGLFLAAFCGAGSLPALRAAMAGADEASGQGRAPRLHPQIDVRTAGDLLSRAGFALPVADVDRMTIRYRGLGQLVNDLRALGWTNILSARAPTPIGREGLRAAAEAFAAMADPDGRTRETFEIIHLSGWAPSPDQPRPAPRGSAVASLADALRAKPQED